MPIRLVSKFENSLFSVYFFNKDFSLNISSRLLIFETQVHDDHLERRMSQIINLSLIFSCMQSRKSSFKK